MIKKLWNRLRESIVAELEKEGVVTWSDPNHRDRFIAIDDNDPFLEAIVNFGVAVGNALADRKVPEDWDTNNLTTEQMLEATATLLDKLDDATDTFLAAMAGDTVERIEREMQNDLRALKERLVAEEASRS